MSCCPDRTGSLDRKVRRDDQASQEPPVRPSQVSPDPQGLQDLQDLRVTVVRDTPVQQALQDPRVQMEIQVQWGTPDTTAPLGTPD